MSMPPITTLTEDMIRELQFQAAREGQGALVQDCVILLAFLREGKDLEHLAYRLPAIRARVLAAIMRNTSQESSTK